MSVVPMIVVATLVAGSNRAHMKVPTAKSVDIGQWTLEWWIP